MFRRTRTYDVTAAVTVRRFKVLTPGTLIMLCVYSENSGPPAPPRYTTKGPLFPVSTTVATHQCRPITSSSRAHAELRLTIAVRHAWRWVSIVRTECTVITSFICSRKCVFVICARKWLAVADKRVILSKIFTSAKKKNNTFLTNRKPQI